ncbi:MAG: hypothetical protein H6R26_116 [Proteobacteria bacterium]|nr:hypothetical protein [Pseudomonadota bacterium]
MKIDNAQVSLSSQHFAQTRTTEKSSLRFWIGDQRPDFEGIGANSAPRPAPPDRVSLSAAVQETQPTRRTADLDDEQKMSPVDSLRTAIVKLMFEALTGREFKLFDPADLSNQMCECVPPPPEAVTQQTQPAQRAGYGLEYDYYASHYEYESLSFSAEGMINTADGQAIAFSVTMNVSREFLSEQRLSIRAGDAAKIDPLVLNFDGRAAELTDTRFTFDLDSDGRQEQIAWLKPGSAFLALDKNSDGVVNDGSELFGPATGDGFAELAAFDEDGNQFIDEGDAIYEQLRLWTRDADGTQQLLALGQKGVGAIYVGHLAAPFELKDSRNTLQGNAVSAGIFINEDGSAGTVQQIDFVA